uniref:Tbk1/Ikki binding domain-containing protein n=1 Tax=Oncorhynchus tshawytscha TaxID=74940 RepID=A0AAZ3RDP0_ONCTS
MERNIGDQLNKAYEAYRQASIERDSAKKELQQMNVNYERHTQKLQKQIEDQQQLISKLKAQLISATKQPSGEVIGEAAPRKQEEETLSPSKHLFDNPGSSLRKIHYLKENMETAVIVSSSPHTAPVASSFETKDVLEVYQALRGKFQQIRTLTQRQKDHLKKIYRGNDMANEQQFSMPIQCTDVAVEQAERPFPSALRPGVDLQHPPMSLASRGASPEDTNQVDSLTTLSIKFPPSTDSEYEFLNSALEKRIDLSLPRATVSTVPAVIEVTVYGAGHPIPVSYLCLSPSLPLRVALTQECAWTPAGEVHRKCSFLYLQVKLGNSTTDFFFWQTNGREKAYK